VLSEQQTTRVQCISWHVADEVGGSSDVENATTCRDEKKIVEELRETFTAKMAHCVYIPFLQLVGR